MSDRLNPNLNDVSRSATEPAPVTIKRSQAWEAIGFITMLVAFIVGGVLGSWQWATLLMLFAIYCAAMR